MKTLQLALLGVAMTLAGCSQPAAPGAVAKAAQGVPAASPGKPSAPVEIRFEAAEPTAGSGWPVTIVVTPTRDLDALEIRYSVPPGLDVGTLAKSESLVARKAGAAWKKQLNLRALVPGTHYLGVVVVTRSGGQEMSRSAAFAVQPESGVTLPEVPAQMQPDGEVVVPLPAS